MDLTPALRNAVLRIRDSIDRFAKTRNWARDNYHLAMAANLVWLHFQVDIFAKEYDSIEQDERTRYDQLYDFLDEDMKDDPSLREAIGALLWPFNCLYARLPSHENYVEIDDSLLNPGWVWPEPISQPTQAG